MAEPSKSTCDLAHFIESAYVRDNDAFVLHTEFVRCWKQCGGNPPGRENLKAVSKDHKLQLRQSQLTGLARIWSRVFDWHDNISLRIPGSFRFRRFVQGFAY